MPPPPWGAFCQITLTSCLTFTRCVLQHIAGEVEVFMCLPNREFSPKSVGERILKIGPYLPKVIIKHQVASFLWRQCTVVKHRDIKRCSSLSLLSPSVRLSVINLQASDSKTGLSHKLFTYTVVNNIPNETCNWQNNFQCQKNIQELKSKDSARSLEHVWHPL